MSDPLSTRARHVQDAIAAAGLDARVVELPATTRSAKEAAAAIGCDVSQIAKSLVFRATVSDRPVLVIASGRHQVNEARLGELLGEPVARADAAFVRDRTGFAIGGVAPVGHLEPMPVFLDETLLTLDEIWAAAGTPHAVFRLAPADLVRLTGGRVVGIT